MTHKELLAKIDKGGARAFQVDSYSWKALRAVVELHSPRSSGPFEFCFACNGWDEEDGTEYPCPTIEAIQEELR